MNSTRTNCTNILSTRAPFNTQCSGSKTARNTADRLIIS